MLEVVIAEKCRVSLYYATCTDSISLKYGPTLITFHHNTYKKITIEIIFYKRA